MMIECNNRLTRSEKTYRIEVSIDQTVRPDARRAMRQVYAVLQTAIGPGPIAQRVAMDDVEGNEEDAFYINHVNVQSAVDRVNLELYGVSVRAMLTDEDFCRLKNRSFSWDPVWEKTSEQ